VSFYQVAFAPETFAELMPWLALNREDLSILVHPETGDDLADHSDHAMWLGDSLTLRLEVFNK
jgi:DOPA 4,5-dioxygenase